jgi:multidrug efflux system membrane fusion protein
MLRRVCAVILLIGGMSVVAGCGQASSQTGPQQQQQQEPLVVYDMPITQMVTDYEDFPGRIDAIYTVEVRARVSGYLKNVFFRDGQEVKKDDVLFEIDPRPFQATYDRQKAALEQAEAHSHRLNNEYHRAKILYEQGRSISREEFDRYAFDYAEAQAALSTAKANLDLAKLDLDWTKVRADLPDGVIGRLSRRMVDPGNLIKADETMMTTIVSQDPLYIYFDVHEQAMLRIRRLLEEGKIKARSEREVPIQISLSDEKDESTGDPVFPHQGIVDFTDNRVDLQTGTLRFRARMSNPTHLITPGLFVKVRLPIGEPHSALLVREQSLQSDQGLKKVFVISPKATDEDRPQESKQPYFTRDAATGKPVLDEGGTIKGRPVTVDVGSPGVLRNGFREISKGVKHGDLVVAVGMQKIRLGKNPLTGEPFLVKARPFDPAKDSAGRTGARPSASSSPATASPPEKSLEGDRPPSPPAPSTKPSGDLNAKAAQPLAAPTSPIRPSGRGSRSGGRR